MKTTLRTGIFAAILILGLVMLAFAPVQSVFAASLDRRGGPGGSGGGYGTGSTLTPLSTAEQSALKSAILEEYGALNLYNAVITQFGSAIPFSQIARSEQQHVNALVNQAQKYGVSVPANPGLSAPVTFATLADACRAGAAAEIADAALYNKLKPVTTHTDLLQVYNNLQSASLSSHLPAFQACQ